MGRWKVELRKQRALGYTPLYGLALLGALVLGIGASTSSQTDPSLPAPPQPSVDSRMILDALKGREWVLLGAIGIYWLAALAKQGWLSEWLQERLPKQALPFFAPLLGVLVLSSSEIIGGTPWPQALIDGVAAGVLAVWGHQAVIQGLRGGKEIVGDKSAERPTSKPPPPAANHGSGTPSDVRSLKGGGQS